jgi:molybdopterin-guanine dinucleotide biosynthesis protein A
MTSKSQHRLNGIILAGGESSRMGSDKSVIDFHGKPQREYVFDLLSEFCDEVHLSCKDKDIKTIPQGLHPLADKFDFKSPLNGIMSAFSQNPHTAWLSVPVDMPNIDRKIISFLLEHRNINKVATCFYDSDGQFPEPLFTVWEATALPLLKAHLAKGQIQPRNFLMTHDVEILKSPDPGMHLNINSRDDLDRYLRGT